MTEEQQDRLDVEAESPHVVVAEQLARVVDARGAAAARVLAVKSDRIVLEIRRD